VGGGYACGGSFVALAYRGAYADDESDGLSTYTCFRFNLDDEKEEDSRHLGGLITLRSFVEQRPLSDVVQLIGEFFCQNGFDRVTSVDINGNPVFEAENLEESVEKLKSGIDGYRSAHPGWPAWGDYVTMACVSKDASFHHAMALRYRPVHNTKAHAFKVGVYSTPNELVKGDGEDEKTFEERLKAFQHEMDNRSKYRAFRSQQTALIGPIVDKFFGYWQALGIKDAVRTTDLGGGE